MFVHSLSPTTLRVKMLVFMSVCMHVSVCLLLILISFFFCRQSLNCVHIRGNRKIVMKSLKNAIINWLKLKCSGKSGINFGNHYNPVIRVTNWLLTSPLLRVLILCMRDGDYNLKSTSKNRSLSN